MRSKRKPSLCRKDTRTDSKSCLPPSAGFTAHATCCLWNASDIIFKQSTKVNPQIYILSPFTRPAKRRNSGKRKGSQWKTAGFPRLIRQWQIKKLKSFSPRHARGENSDIPAAVGSFTSVSTLVVGVFKGKAAKRCQRQIKRAVFEAAARLAGTKCPGIVMPQRCMPAPP